MISEDAEWYIPQNQDAWILEENLCI
jgi:hypothetical protein